MSTGRSLEGSHNPDVQTGPMNLIQDTRACQPSRLINFHLQDVTVDIPRLAQDSEDTLKLATRRYHVLDADTHLKRTSLLFVHGVGTHKEHWEPIIEALFRTQARSGTTIFHEAWSLDWPSHGDSAALNSRAFSKPEACADIPKVAECIAELVKTCLSPGRIICVGHSGGSLALLYSTMLYTAVEQVPYESMILVEPVAVDRQSFLCNVRDRTRLAKLFRIVLSHPEEWDSREAAYEWLRQRLPWKTWDSRYLQLYVEKGLYSSQTGGTKVSPKCTRKHEARHYMEHQSMFQATEQVERICASVPIHLIFGEKKDFALTESRKCLTDVTKGRYVASLSQIPGAGHMVIQQKPDQVAHLVWDILGKSVSTAESIHLFTAKL